LINMKSIIFLTLLLVIACSFSATYTGESYQSNTAVNKIGQIF